MVVEAAVFVIEMLAVVVKRESRRDPDDGNNATLVNENATNLAGTPAALRADKIMICPNKTMMIVCVGAAQHAAAATAGLCVGHNTGYRGDGCGALQCYPERDVFVSGGVWLRDECFTRLVAELVPPWVERKRGGEREKKRETELIKMLDGMQSERCSRAECGGERSPI